MSDTLPPKGSILLLACHDCQIKYEVGPLGEGRASDAIFRIPRVAGFPDACPRCGSTNMNTGWVKEAVE